MQVAAPAGCEAEARRFYGELLGLSEIEKPDELKPRGGVWFSCGAQQLHVGVERDFAGPARKAHPAFAVREADELLAALQQGGAKVVRDGPRVYTEDPWGNRIELVLTS